MTRPSVIQLNPSSNVSGSGDNVVDEDDSKSDKPQRSRRSSKASKEDKEFENETKKYLYMAAVEDVKSASSVLPVLHQSSMMFCFIKR